MPQARSSGDLLADKRFGYAESLAAEGDLAAAAELYEQAVALAPHWAAAHLAWALALDGLGQRERAKAILVDADRLDHDGSLGAALHRARLSGEHVDALPASYVAALFDQYAPRFDRHLTEALDYRGPAVLVDCLDRCGHVRHGAVLDLGCGTGLMARALDTGHHPIDGIDLSAAMVERARATGLYRRLIVGDCVACMRDLAADSYVLVIAADVLVYMGDLIPFMTGAARVLVPGGLIAATVQAGHPGESAVLGADLRFRHGTDHIRAAAAEAGLAIVALDPCTTRREGGRDVPGLVFAARAP